MPIVLFAIIGANINAGAAYWICFAVYCIAYILKAACEAIKEMME